MKLSNISFLVFIAVQVISFVKGKMLHFLILFFVEFLMFLFGFFCNILTLILILKTLFDCVSQETSWPPKVQSCLCPKHERLSWFQRLFELLSFCLSLNVEQHLKTELSADTVR